MLYGFAGKVLHVDLTNGTLDVEEPPEDFYRKYWGGSLMGLYYLMQHTPAGADALGPDNALVFAISAPTGLAISGQSRATAVAKSPLTGCVGDSQAGGFWPAELKFSGFDAIVIRGASPKPVYLWLHDGEAEIRDAAHLWGKITGEAEAAIKEELGDAKIEVAQIGPAGEKRVRFAAIMNMSNRAHGRTGLGAVMGAKNLKAVAVRGRLRPKPADPKAIARLAKTGPGEYENNASVANLGDLGTANAMLAQNAAGGQPSHNYTSGVFEGAEAISGERMHDTILKERDTCYACIVRCKRVVATEYKGQKVDPFYGGPEYETLSTFGSYCNIADLDALALAHQLCAQYGVDTMTAGATIAFAMECFEHGLITADDTDGIELRFGDADAMLAMLRKMLDREGFGDILAEGSARAAERIGRGASDFVIAVKGQELAAHMPQGKRSLEVIYATNPFGADHQSSEHDTLYMPKSPPLFLDRLARLGLTSPQKPKDMNEDKVRFALYTQYNYSALDTLTLCQFVWGPSYQLYGPDELVEMVRAATGWQDVTVEEIQRMGARRINLMRAFNAREGIGRDRDTLPKKLFQPLKGGRTEGLALDRQEFETALEQYYQMAGWDADTGYPSRETLNTLGLEWAAM
jgi:aldehyde:ferredoxin oxidoreductase